MNQKPAQTIRTILLAFLFVLAANTLSGCVKRSREGNLRTQTEPQSARTPPSDQQFLKFPDQSSSKSQTTRQPININIATAERLEELPGIGKALAQRIVEHREKYGAFRRPEHLIMVRGISDRRLRALRNLITVE